MKRASAFVRRGALYAQGSSRTRQGLWILDGPLARLDVGADDEDWGKAVLEALEASRQDVPAPTSWSRVTAPLLDGAGVKTWEIFADGALSVDLEMEDGRLRLIPSRNLGPGEGFAPLPAKATELETEESAAIGNALREALGECA